MNGFLLDENLPSDIGFSPTRPVFHARSLGASLPDSALWRYARERGLVIVSKDADFSHRMMLAAPPPWVVHLRLGNLRTREFQSALAKLWPGIKALLPAHKLINVYPDRIEAVEA